MMRRILEFIVARLPAIIMGLAFIATPAFGQGTPSNPLNITGANAVPTFGAGASAVLNTGTGDLFCLQGSATQVVRLKRMRLAGIATAAVTIEINLTLRSTLDTGGTSTTPAPVNLDTGSTQAATASVRAYSVSPTPGTALGSLRHHKLQVVTAGANTAMDEDTFDLSSFYDSPVVLRDANHSACLNLTTAGGAGSSFTVEAEWIETPL